MGFALPSTWYAQFLTPYESHYQMVRHSSFLGAARGISYLRRRGPAFRQDQVLQEGQGLTGL